MRVLVTGASGFIGSHVVKALLGAGHTVLGLVLPQDDLWRLSEVLDRVQLLKGDINEISDVRSNLRAWQPHVCIHLAWYAEPGKYLHSRENIVCLQGSLQLLEELYAQGCNHFIGAGTCAEYKMKPGLLSEDDRTEPESLYAAAKLSFKVLGEQLAMQSGRQFSWGRIFHLYGPYEDPRRLVPAAILRLQNGEPFETSPGEQIRDFLHVKDVAGAFLTIMEKGAPGTFNICSSEAVSVRVLLDTIAVLMDQSALISYGALPYRDWEPMHIRGNNTRLKSLAWQPRFGLRAGLEDVIGWWSANRERSR